MGRETIFNVAMVTIFFSVMAHGISAAPLAEKYGVRITQMIKKGSAQAEAIPGIEVPTRKGIIPTDSSYQD